MNNAKEKAKELFLLMLGDDQGTHPKVFRKAKDRAIIAVDEIIKLNCLSSGWQEGTNLPITDTMRPYWQEVKQEIERL